jgi:hypothetical protein
MESALSTEGMSPAEIAQRFGVAYYKEWLRSTDRPRENEAAYERWLLQMEILRRMQNAG